MLLLEMFYVLGLDSGDFGAYVFVSGPALLGGVLQALVLRRVYKPLTRGAAAGYAVCWALSSLTGLLLLRLPSGVPALLTWLSSGILGGVISSLWLRWALPGRNWEDTLWAIGGWIAGWGMGLGGLGCSACIVLFTGLEDDPVTGIFGFALAGALAGSIGAGALEWPNKNRVTMTAPAATGKQ